MSKTVKTEETVFAAFDASKVTDQVRDFAEKTVAQSKDAYAKMKDSAEGAQKTFEDNVKVAQAASSDVALKAIAAIRTNTEAGINHLEALVDHFEVGNRVELHCGGIEARIRAEDAVDSGVGARQHRLGADLGGA